MLRRFFARRGTPTSITSGSSPTFALGETILSECRQRAQEDPTIAKEICTRRSIPSREELCTVIIEIEALLNTRPLLYVGSENE
ncbi:hypothetical protein NECAME_08158 [Necator americanus]|uniref:Uncharacterized protein n=1 Tax=Necator americanus TaxID=51031 RepID=W2TJY1_NECAM|nr:hypothetical protein NECAME_08158 [Necator americanus]ETN82108.1 hypothetical protein NECAME_08158 [Necator americanus]